MPAAAPRRAWCGHPVGRSMRCVCNPQRQQSWDAGACQQLSEALCPGCGCLVPQMLPGPDCWVPLQVLESLRMGGAGGGVRMPLDSQSLLLSFPGTARSCKARAHMAAAFHSGPQQQGGAGLKTYPNYMMGGGYVVSGDVAASLVNINKHMRLKFTPIEDATLGFWLMSMDLRHIDHPRSAEECLSAPCTSAPCTSLKTGQLRLSHTRAGPPSLQGLGFGV